MKKIVIWCKGPVNSSNVLKTKKTSYATSLFGLILLNVAVVLCLVFAHIAEGRGSIAHPEYGKDPTIEPQPSQAVEADEATKRKESTAAQRISSTSLSRNVYVEENKLIEEIIDQYVRE
ncbi:hypothetical protein PoB_006711800 [Plakobranchus ocellatus]|uniref:Uncharacterized protein n=1 Tax=Plakobranchus ocellatus TaxID=259542 RepID=A0AAV4D986_9GAST|nr:hypothetical protein PoB_006711800 [Plakobranchus ocellatus]